ncbi:MULTISPECIES: aromatic ring-hydroxylating oxygenase subunit alpha [Nitrospirillum]|uniref:Phenylpropionate dioxygenase-like ring-hydroxylating dioxygenase large terminal subunit n=1 Tax=Nitrospirillum amazonense TaxID=28077 RepID=A0A560G3E2_9PROT|nr:aromatic ring-hydroxylating dioxygenase subunit alpha [Nitrospirillum amazonense]MEC4591969.1 aromatic ring-hydroxylating dioxygenase subunit alpha [Nitrospirillum amazonense]TWB28362.1 phenylpropionate dioxygenase-like ring-hydroxylating dioxygenase large terminal subunit [Nitrospirillum amazonense]
MKHSFLNDAFFSGLDSSALGVEAAETLPPLCYTDREFYEFEKEALFNHEWLCVGRESWVKETGDYFTTSIIDEPIVVARGRDGMIRAMSSVCQHRAMLVAEGQGNTRAFLCPYHHWSYGLDGQLIGAPAMEKTCNFDKKDIKLPQFKVEVWHGFIFVNFDLDAPALAPRLAALEGVMAPYSMATLNGPAPDRDIKFPWNWKVMFENNNDGYHANRLHGGALHDFVPSRLAAFPDDLPADTAGYYRTNGTLHADASFNPTQKAILPVFPALGEAERNRMLFVNVPPTLSLVITSDMIIYLILRADGAETHLMDQGYLVAPGALEDPLFDDKLAMNKHSTAAIIAQDLHVDEMVQVGLRSRHAIRGRYSWQEQAQREFNGWLVRRYQDTWARVKPTA